MQLFDCFAVDSETAIAFLIIGCIIFLLSLIHIAANPFCYPYFYYTFDVTGKRNINIEDCIERFLCNQCNWRNVYSHQQLIECWKRNQQRYLETCSFKKLRLKQYNKTVNDINAFCFVATRNQTRYRQRNYVKTSYSTSVVVARYNVSWQWLLDRHNLLAQIGFESTLKEYYAHNQRIILARFVESKCLMRLDFKSTTLSQSSKEEKQCLLIYVFFVANAMREKDQNSTNVPLQYMMIFASIFIDNTLHQEKQL